MAGAAIETVVRIVKTQPEHGLVFGFAMVCCEDGEPYFDLQGHHIPEDAMLGASVDFMATARVAKAMHDGEPAGQILFGFPLTTDIAKALEIETPRTGLLVAMKPEADMLAKFMSGEYTGFSIGGYAQEIEEVAENDE